MWVSFPPLLAGVVAYLDKLMLGSDGVLVMVFFGERTGEAGNEMFTYLWIFVNFSFSPNGILISFVVVVILSLELIWLVSVSTVCMSASSLLN